MLTTKNVLAVVLSIVVGYFLIKVLWWMLFVAFSIAITVVQIVFILLLAVPLYIIIRRKILS